MRHLKIVSFTKTGASLSAKIRQLLGQNYQIERYARTVDPSLTGTYLRRFVQQAMYDCEALIFIGAAGIAVREIAPYLRGKLLDPAVLVLDEKGKFVIPLLSGHWGGANRLAEELAGKLGAQAVLTTATDVQNRFAVDVWAKEHACTILESERLKTISGDLLRGKTVGFATDFAVDCPLPERVEQDATAASGFVVSLCAQKSPFSLTLHLVPKLVVAGIGCRRGKTRDELYTALMYALRKAGVHPAALAALASIDCKRDETGLLELAQSLSLPLHFFSAADLQTVPDEGLSRSAFVMQTVGVDAVSERAALLASKGQILAPKIIDHGVTVTLAAPEWKVTF